MNNTQLDDLTTTFKDDSTSQTRLENKKIEFTPIEEPTPIKSQDDILRKILINRLTDEEKELIRLFGGQIC